MSINTQKELEKNKQVGIRLPIDLYKILEAERLEALERGEKLTMTEIIVKYIYAGLGGTPMELKGDIFMPTLERLTDVLDRLEQKL